MPADAVAPRLLARTGAGHARADRAVHVLAQLGEATSLRVTGAGADRAGLRRLAQAYGIESRLRLGGPVTASNGEITVDAPCPSAQRTCMAQLVHRVDQGADAHAPPRGDDGLLAGLRIVFVTNRPAHYRVALLNRLHDRLDAVQAELCVLFTAARPWSRGWMKPESMRFEHHFLRSIRVGLPSDLPLDLERRLLRPPADIVLIGTFSPLIAGRAALLCATRRMPLGIVSGEIPWQDTAQGGLRRAQRLAVMRGISFAITYGHASAEYLQAMVAELPLVYGRNATPILDEPAARRSRPEQLEILAVGQAIHRKGLDIAVDAMAQVEDLPCRLTVVGGGEDLAALVRRAGGRGNVRFSGAVPSDEVLDAYRAADLFLFPTRSDIFGLVLVEAMGAGLPTIASTAAGAIADLAVPDENCVLVEGEDPAAWAQAIRELVDDPERRALLGDAARRTVVRRWTLAHETDAWMAGLRLGVLTARQ